jgi:predicted Zn-dependent peptidase
MGAPLPPKASPNFQGGVTVQDFPGPQSTVLFSQGGINVKDPDFMAASLINEIFGGGRFTARLMTELRDKRGLTYGVGTGLASMAYAESMNGSFQASNEKVAEAVDVLRAEWAKLAAGDLTASLQALAALKDPVDAFFDAVMVNAEDPALRANRLSLLRALHAAMNQVADLSRLAA